MFLVTLEKEFLHSTSLLGTQQGLQGICILVRETEKRSNKVKVQAAMRSHGEAEGPCNPNLGIQSDLSGLQRKLLLLI